MDLKHFEYRIDPVILDRGEQLLEKKAVKSLRVDHGECTARVQGTELYTVKITLTRAGKVYESRCNCPFNRDEYCKHQAAVFLTLKEIAERPGFVDWETLQMEETAPAAAPKKSATAKTPPHAPDDLPQTGGADEAYLKSVRDIVRETITDAKHHGFVNYRDMNYALRGADEALAIAEEKLKANDLETCVRICVMLIDEMLRLLPNCDDSDGGPGDIMDWSSQYILEALDKMPACHPARDSLFQAILKILRHKHTQDWQLDYIPLLVPLADTEKKRKTMEGLLAPHLGGREYARRRAQEIQLDLVKRYDGEEAYDKFLYANLDNPKFREAAVQREIGAGNLKEALRLCLAGEKTDAAYRELVSQWQHYRLEIYQRQNDAKAQAKLHETFVMAGDIASYHALREMLDEKTWREKRVELLAKLKVNDQKFGLYKKIFILEDCQHELFELLQEKGGSSFLIECYPYLGPQYAAGLAPLFRRWIIGGFNAYFQSRKYYQETCEKIRHFQAACGKEAAAPLIAELEKEYKKRPAFMEELAKIK